MTLRERVDEFRLMLRAEIIGRLLMAKEHNGYLEFHGLCSDLVEMNPIT